MATLWWRAVLGRVRMLAVVYAYACQQYAARSMLLRAYTLCTVHVALVPATDACLCCAGTYVVRCTREACTAHCVVRGLCAVLSGLSYATRTAVRVRGLYSDRTCGGPHVALRSAIHSFCAFGTVVLWCGSGLSLCGAGPCCSKAEVV